MKLTLSVLAVLALAHGSGAAQTGATAGTSYDAPDGSLSFGTYQIQGNRLIARADNGQQATFTIEIVDGGKGMKIDGELYIRE